MRAIIVGAFILASANVQAQDYHDEHDRFRLYAGCAPVGLLVEGLGPPATDIGLTRNAILTTVRSRLRGARIYSSEQYHVPYLYVNINVLGRAFSIKINLNKYVSDLETELIYPATTWTIGGTGTHGQDPGYILQGLGQYMDQYLAVNESACE